MVDRVDEMYKMIKDGVLAEGRQTEIPFYSIQLPKEPKSRKPRSKAEDSQPFNSIDQPCTSGRRRAVKRLAPSKRKTKRL